MKKIILLFITLSFFACQTKKKMNDDFKGNWISQDYLNELDQHNGNPSKVKENYYVELGFPKEIDSVMRWVNTGVEVRDFTIEILGSNKIRVEHFNHDLYTDFELSNDGKTITYDYKELDKKFTFVKIDPSQFREKPNTFFYANAYINKKLIAGDYINLKNDSVATIGEDGYMKGMDPFASYSICVAGDCRSFSANPTMFIEDKNGNGSYYEYEKINDTLKIYSLNYSDYSNMKGPYSRKELKYSLLRKK